MEAKVVIAQAQNLIAKGNTDQALAVLLAYFKAESLFKAEAIDDARARTVKFWTKIYKDNEKQHHKGILSDAECLAEQSTVADSLLDFLKEWTAEIKDYKRGKPHTNGGVSIEALLDPEPITETATAGEIPEPETDEWNGNSPPPMPPPMPPPPMEVPPPMPPPPSEGSDTNPLVENAVATEVPPVMQVGVEARCRVRIGQDVAQVTAGLTAGSFSVDTQIKLTKIVSVELRDPSTDDNFVIKPRHPAANQPLFKGDVTEWSWTVKPNQAGSFALNLVVGALFNIDGDHVTKYTVLEKNVQVEVSTDAPKPAPILPTNKQEIIFFVAASPTDTATLRTGNEYNAIDTEVQLADTNFELLQLQAATYTGFMRILRKKNPQILHLSLHGDHENLFFEREDGTSDPIVSLVPTLQTAQNLRCVILSACYSAAQATAIKAALPHLAVIGSTDALPDLHATKFSQGFYMTLDNTANYAAAFDCGRALIAATDPDIAKLLMFL